MILPGIGIPPLLKTWKRGCPGGRAKQAVRNHGRLTSLPIWRRDNYDNGFIEHHAGDFSLIRKMKRLLKTRGENQRKERDTVEIDSRCQQYAYHLPRQYMVRME
jgi:hypothetical protein